MITGDAVLTGKAIGKQLGVRDVQANVMPDEKAKIINENKIGNVKIFKDDFKNVDDFESYKNMFNSHINREGTADEYVSFNTINLSNMKDYNKTKSSQIKKVYKISKK